MTHGFRLAGVNVLAGIDNDESCKYAYEKNNKSKFIKNDIRNVSGIELGALYNNYKIKILIGCAPCQTFARYTKDDESDERWKLLYEFARIVKESNPDVVSMENVPRLKNYLNGKVFNDFVNSLKELGYFVSYDLLYCPDYGVPQKRKRLVLLASKFGPIALPKKLYDPINYLTVKKAIGPLEPIEAGETSKKDPLHYSRKLEMINKLRIIKTPSGGDWRDWPKELVLDCHKKESGKSFKNVYGRMLWEEPSPTITTESINFGTGRFGHPEQNRALSLREMAILQSFPKYYDFIDKKRKFSSTNIARHIGNAVPVKLGQVIAESIIKHIEDHHIE